MSLNDAFAGICKEDIWNENTTWNSHTPNFSRCLRYTVLSWFPCGFLLLCSINEYFSIKNFKRKNLSWRILNSSKLILTLLAIFGSIFEFGYYVNEYLGDRFPYIFFVTSAIRVFTFLVVALLLSSQKDKGIPTSGVLWFFFLFHSICLIPTVTQLWLHKETFKSLEYDYNILFTIVIFLLFILLCFADVPSGKDRSILEQEVLEHNERKRKPTPESSASFLSRLYFWWFTETAILGYKKPLVTDDLFDLSEEIKSVNAVPIFEKNWLSSDCCNRINVSFDPIHSITPTAFKRSKRSILKAIVRTYISDIFVCLFLSTLNSCCGLISPVLFKYLLQFMAQGLSEPMWHGILLAISMFLVSVVGNISFNAFFMKALKLGMKIQSSLMHLVYKKTLVITSAEKKTSTSGEIVNLMAVDTQRIKDVAIDIFFVFTAPLEAGVAIYLLFNLLGYSAFGGLSTMVVAIPISFAVGTIADKFQTKQMNYKDERVKYLNETLNGMKVLKLYAWEQSFMKVITDIRNKELNAYKIVSYMFAITLFLWNFAPFLVILVTFAIYLYTGTGHVLSAEKVFVTMSLIEILKFPLTIVPQVISYMVMAYVSVKRLNKFLNAAELSPYVTRKESDVAISVSNAHFRWELPENESSDSATEPLLSNSEILSDINLKVKLGSLHAVVGPVGSGKSSLLSALLGEMEKVKGTVNIKRNLNIAYVPQLAWIENLTLRDNILFGKPYYKEKYEAVLDACALRADLEILGAGDMTEIGEKGINLSGGQKQRISLARACYSDADLFFFDDPLSAVDANVAKHLFNYVFSSEKGLLKHKTRILVTNRLESLSKVDFISVLKDGHITEQGTYSELMSRNNDFADLINQYSTTKESKNDGKISTQTSLTEAKEENVTEKKKDTLVDEEIAQVGSVSLAVYMQYLKQMSTLWIFLILFGFCGFQAVSVGGNVWLSQWSKDNSTGDVMKDDKKREYRFLVYGLIGLLQTLFICLGNYAGIKGGLEVSSSLHKKMLLRIFQSPMSFFETTPLGRIVNRFSKDIDSVDTTLPSMFKDCIICTFEVLFSLGVVAAQTGYFILVITPVVIAYYFLQKVFVATSRQLQRLYSINSSPVYAHFSQTLQGVSTIRSFHAGDRFLAESDKRVDLNQMCFYSLIAGNRWLSVLLNTFGSVLVLFVGLYAALRRADLNAADVGLSISYALTVTDVLNWMVRSATLIETNIVSVERISEYCKNETEADWIVEECRPPIHWPQNGEVEFDKYSTRYRRGLDLVLRELSANVKSGEKIGIVGRTGAGKSTITLSLFRIIEAAEGLVKIDELNIANIGLHDLRSKLTIIPQDPVLFSGTLRFNLDPFDVYSDAAIWEALQHSHLSDFVSSLEKGLSHQISEGGENLSVGQRQLICLARALLRKSKILVLDEATAAVDLETDSLIQTTIKTEFADCTTLTIAHRIQTILECDRVMVIDNGRLIEFDAPAALLSNKDSTFYSLAKNAGVVS